VSQALAGQVAAVQRHSYIVELDASPLRPISFSSSDGVVNELLQILVLFVVASEE